MQPVSPQTIVQNPQPSQVVCHLKQYWPAWIYKATLTGLAIGQYGLNRWQFTAGVAGVGLVAMYALSYFLRNEDVVVNPAEVEQYQELNDRNIANLGVAERVVDDIESLVSRQEQIQKQGEDGILRNREVVSFDRRTLAQMADEKQEDLLSLKESTSIVKQSEIQIDDLLRAEGKNIKDLKSKTFDLDQVVAKGRKALEASEQV